MSVHPVDGRGGAIEAEAPPVLGKSLDDPEESRAPFEASGRHTIKTIDELEAIHHGAIKLAGAELGLEAFGMQVLDLPAGFSEYPEHDHSADGQEEAYVVLRGSIELQVDGQALPVRCGQIVRVSPAATRKLTPGSDGARVLAIGAVADGPYERPQHFRCEARA